MPYPVGGRSALHALGWMFSGGSKNVWGGGPRTRLVRRRVSGEMEMVKVVGVKEVMVRQVPLMEMESPGGLGDVGISSWDSFLGMKVLYSPLWASLRKEVGVEIVRMVEPPSGEGVRLVIARGGGLRQAQGFCVLCEVELRLNLTAELLNDAGEHPLRNLCALETKVSIQRNRLSGKAVIIANKPQLRSGDDAIATYFSYRVTSKAKIR